MEKQLITPIILAGGNGSRLWPLSREATPKQFCRYEGEKSLFQKTVTRVSDTDMFTSPIVVCNEMHGALAEGQLSEININADAIICEPCGRDTAAAILLATKASLGDDDQLFLVMPSDHEIRDTVAFMNAVRIAATEATNNERIITFGIKPTYPETGFGYLRTAPIDNNSGCFELSSFIEKPCEQRAEQLIQESNVFWNAGIFLFSNQTICAEFNNNAPILLSQVAKAAIEGTWKGKMFSPNQEIFAKISPISFDYAIMEKTDRAAVVPVDPRWSDMGSWKTVWETSSRNKDNNALRGPVYTSETDHSLVHSSGPVVGVCGLDDVIVVANHDAVLVTSRDNPQGVKDLVEQMRLDDCPVVHSHIGEDRPWGRFDSIDRGESHQVKRIRVNPQGQLSLQYHHHRAEHWVVVSGLATVTVDKKVMQLGPCQQVFIAKGAVHRLENMTDEPVEIIEVQYGEYLGEDDIVRLEDVYGRNPVETPLINSRAA